ncbi:M56 family metallopeptidase [Bythopirellula goksoeyrii]|uniref:Regulatory protein BlaR1 n=1 Tax=Bythopirellula goksoeyrii TaxID=1400387 RepID=A0A5B9Q3N0_9BACT|nr:M56 family metallopeptidase [Bythopirellula goksoeyrii]QEG33604.1 Regulatory protein BlaR1 [Bythopirellula goksoeyrii]
MNVFILSSVASSLLMHSLLRITLVLTCAWIAHRLLSDHNPSWRILVWRVASVGILCLVVFSVQKPLFTLSLLPRIQTDSMTLIARTNDYAPVEPMASQLKTDETRSDHARRVPSDEPDARVPMVESSNMASEVQSAKQDAQPSQQQTKNVKQKARIWVSQFSWLLIVWVLGIAWGVARLLVGIAHVKQISRTSTDTPAWVKNSLQSLMNGELNASSFQLRCTRAFTSPCTVGFFQPTILLPEDLCNHSCREELLSALAHELEHIRGNDLRWNFAIHGMSIVLWFHPLVWRIRLAHADACDERCDSYAARSLPDPCQYGPTLARMALRAAEPTAPLVLTMARQSSISRRIAALEKGIGRLPVPRWQTSLVFSTAFFFVLCLAQVGINRSQAVATQAATEEAPEKNELAKIPKAGFDIYGDPLPQGAIARLGTLRYRHPGWYKHCAFLPDNETFVVGTDDNTVRFWDARSGKMVDELDFGEDRFVTFCLSHDGNRLATLSRSHRPNPLNRKDKENLIIWDSHSRQSIKRISWTEEGRGISTLAFSPSGESIAAAARDGTVSLWEIESGIEEIKQETIKGGEIESMVFSPSGEVIAVASQFGVKLFNLWTKENGRPLPGLPHGGQVVEFSPDGAMLAVGSDYNFAASLYDVQSGELLRQLHGKRKDYYREQLCFSSDGSTLIVPAREAHAVEFFDVESGELQNSLDAGIIQPRAVTISPDGKLLACVGSEDAIVVWDFETGETLSDSFIGHEEDPHELLFNRDGQELITGSVDGSIRIWDAATGRQIRRLSHEHWVAGLALSPDDKWILSCSLDETVRLWDFATGKERYRLPGHGRVGGNSTTAVAFSADGKKFYSFGIDLFLRAYSTKTGRILEEFAIRPSGMKIAENEAGTVKERIGDPFSEEQIDQAILSSGTSLLAVSGRRKSIIYFFDTKTGQEVNTFHAQDRLMRYVVSPAHNLLVTIEQSTKVGAQPNARPLRTYFLRKVNLDTKQVVQEIELAESFASALTLSEDGKLLALCQSDPNWSPISKQWIDVYSVDDLKPQARVPGFKNQVVRIEFSPDNSQLATSQRDSTVLIWNLKEFEFNTGITRINQSRPQLSMAGLNSNHSGSHP